MIVSSKIPTKLLLDFCLEFFCSFLGASWKLFGLPGDLVSNIINKEAYKKPKVSKFQKQFSLEYSLLKTNEQNVRQNSAL